MTSLILPRRRFLFASAAIVASSSLMKVHDIGDLAFTRYRMICNLGQNEPQYSGYQWRDGAIEWHRISAAEYAWNRKQMAATPGFEQPWPGGEVEWICG